MIEHIWIQIDAIWPDQGTTFGIDLYQLKDGDIFQRQKETTPTDNPVMQVNLTGFAKGQGETIIL